MNTSNFRNDEYLYIMKLIQQGEHQKLDFKFAVSDSRKIARSLVAFANTDGGSLLIGVKDNGKIAGIRSEEEIYMVDTASLLHCKPTVKYSLRLWEPLQDKQVLEVIVPQQHKELFYAKNDDDVWSIFLRYKDSNIIVGKIYEIVWKHRNNTIKQPVKYDKQEQLLHKHLVEHEKYTFEQIQNMTTLSVSKLEYKLAELVILGIMDMSIHSHELVFEMKKTDEKIIKVDRKK
jgi:predicted HTH transcriptional regulator